jgi:hypothetical protein
MVSIIAQHKITASRGLALQRIVASFRGLPKLPLTQFSILRGILCPNSIYWDKPVDQRQTEVSLFMSLVLRPAQDLGKHIFKPESAPNG